MIAADRARKAEHDKNRPTARQRGYDTAWEKARRGFLAKHPFCEHCRQNAATIVHHKIPHRGDRLKFWNRANWQAVCQPCHDGPLQAAERRAQ
jgi:5-methylcytosine-specific restriction endonuclease McrA